MSASKLSSVKKKRPAPFFTYLKMFDRGGSKFTPLPTEIGLSCGRLLKISFLYGVNKAVSHGWIAGNPLDFALIEMPKIPSQRLFAYYEKVLTKYFDYLLIKVPWRFDSFWSGSANMAGGRASSRSTNARKFKEKKMPRMNEKTANLQWNRDARKLKGREIWGCAKIRGEKIKRREI